LEARLSAALRAGGRETIVEKISAVPEEVVEAVARIERRRAERVARRIGGVGDVVELRAKGERATPAATEAVEEIDTKALPSLDELVKRIPPEVREWWTIFSARSSCA